MTVNGVDVIKYGVRQWNLQPDFSELKNESEWISGAMLPMMQNGTAGFKKMKVSIMIRGDTRQEIWQKSGDFIAGLMDPCEYRFDNFEHCFYGYLKNASQAETSLQRWHKATLELVGYEYGAEVINSTTAKTIAVQNEGNMLTPAIIEITPVINLVELSIGGLVRNFNTGEEKVIKVRNLNNGRKIIIDGVTGLITEEGINKFAEVDLWDLPALLPGNNQITVDKDINLTIRHKPRYF